jgi:hypothetical protein
MPIARIRLLLAAAVTGYLTLAAAAPGAWAHGANGQPIPDAAHYRTTITGISPPTPGLSARVDPRGEWLEVTNTTSKTLTVLGYAREPYLQIDAAGVAENVASPTLVLNQSLFGDLSQFGGSTAPPSWRHTSDARQVRWHDHRIHWMGAGRPPAVKADPGAGHQVGTWTVHMTLASDPVTVTGTLNWLPVKNRTRLWSVVFLIVDSALLLGAVAGWFLLRRRKAGKPDRDTSDITGIRGAWQGSRAGPVGTTGSGGAEDADAVGSAAARPVSRGTPSG